jgi:hypothetical protein
VIFSNPTKEGAITHWFVSSEKLTVVLMRRQLSRLFMNMPEISEKLFGFSPTVLGNQARGANLMEAGRA